MVFWLNTETININQNDTEAIKGLVSFDLCML